MAVNRKLTPASQAVDQAIDELGHGASRDLILQRADKLVSYDDLMADYKRRYGREFGFSDIKRMFLENAFARRVRKALPESGGMMRQLESYVVDQSTGERVFKFINEMSVEELEASEMASHDLATANRKRELVKLELRMRVQDRESRTGRQLAPAEVQGIIDSESFVEWMEEVHEMTAEEVDSHYHAVIS